MTIVVAAVVVFVKSGIVVGDMVVVLGDTREEVEDIKGSVVVRTAFSVAGSSIVGPEKTCTDVGVTAVVV